MGVKDKRKDSCNICIKQYSVTSVIIGFTLNVTQLHLVGTINFVKRRTRNFFFSSNALTKNYHLALKIITVTLGLNDDNSNLENLNLNICETKK